MTGYRFLCGAAMAPTAVRAAYPDARFVARARLADPGAGGGAEVWGILIEATLGEADRTAPVRPVETDDGRRLVAHADPTPTGEPEAVVAAARYWELPPAYVQMLAEQRLGDRRYTESG